MVAPKSRNGRSLPCTASTARVRAPAFEPPGSRSIRINSTEASSSIKATLLPALEELEGFCSASLLVDRASGRGVAAATFDNAEAIEQNKDQLDRIKATGSREANAEVLDQCDFELALAHLRVPEMA